LIAADLFGVPRTFARKYTLRNNLRYQRDNFWRGTNKKIPEPSMGASTAHLPAPVF
jgi:hypothetical protein